MKEWSLVGIASVFGSLTDERGPTMDNSKFLPTTSDAALPGDPNVNLMQKVEQTLARLDEIESFGDLTELRRQA
jgi:hypothetical protein